MSDEAEDAARRKRIAEWNEFTTKIEQLVREYGRIIYDPTEYEWMDEDDRPSPPDWTNPLAISDWTLIIGVEDIDPDSTQRGHWVLHVEPWQQLPHRTMGLLYWRISEMDG